MKQLSHLIKLQNVNSFTDIELKFCVVGDKSFTTHTLSATHAASLLKTFGHGVKINIILAIYIMNHLSELTETLRQKLLGVHL